MPAVQSSLRDETAPRHPTVDWNSRLPAAPRYARNRATVPMTPKVT